MSWLGFDNVRKRYGAIVALDGVSFDVGAGEVVGLLGPNGAGKSTLMRCATTLLQPDSGTIVIGGNDVRTNPRTARASLGYVAQQSALDKYLSGREMLRLHAALCHVPAAEVAPRIERALMQVDLERHANRRISTYSGGMKRRLDLASTMLHDPRVLILDEPTAGLDLTSRASIWAFIQQRRKAGAAILMATHHVEEIEALSDRVALIDHGVVRAIDTPSNIRKRSGVEIAHVMLGAYTEPELAATAAGRLRALPFVSAVYVDPSAANRLTIGFRSQQEPEAIRRHAAHAAGMEPSALFDVSIHTPSLQDAFLLLTGNSIAGGAENTEPSTGALDA